MKRKRYFTCYLLHPSGHGFGGRSELLQLSKVDALYEGHDERPLRAEEGPRHAQARCKLGELALSRVHVASLPDEVELVLYLLLQLQQRREQVELELCLLQKAGKQHKALQIARHEALRMGILYFDSDLLPRGLPGSSVHLSDGCC